MKPRCYIASPLGFTEAGRQYYTEVYLPALSGVVEAVDPWSLTTQTEIAAAHRAGQHREILLEIGRRNIRAIESSVMLAAWLDGQEPDSGTAAEVGYAAALRIPCFGLRTDLRQTGEPGADVNLQVQTFIEDSGGRLLGSLAELVDALTARAADSGGLESHGTIPLD